MFLRLKIIQESREANWCIDIPEEFIVGRNDPNENHVDYDIIFWSNFYDRRQS